MSDGRTRGHSLEWLIGADSRGRWIVVERAGRMGGIFSNEQDARKFARFESGEAGCRILEATGRLNFAAVSLARPD